MVQGVDDCLDVLEHDALEHRLLRHPFLQGLKDAAFSRRQLSIWVGQQFYFSSQFPRCLASLYARLEDFEGSRPLMDFLWIEHWGSTCDGAHWRMFREVMSFFGYEIGTLKGRRPFEETSIFLDHRLNICLRGRIEEGLGAIAYGHELVNEEVFRAYLRGVEGLGDVPERALEYFRAHVEQEEEDYALLRSVIASVCRNVSQVELVASGTLEILEARAVFFDRLLERLDAEGA